MAPKFNRRVLALLVSAAVAVPVTVHVVGATFAPSCASQPREAWMSSYEIGLRLSRRGYEMVRIQFAQDRCVDIVARDRNGRFVDLRVNPFSAEIVKGAE